jgi:hypothetical protein
MVVLGLVALLHGRPWLAGMLTAFSGWVRLVHVVFVAALPRRAWVPAIGMLGVLAGWQLIVHGSLLGYEDSVVTFSLEHVTGRSWLEVVGNPSEVPNIVYYPAILYGYGAIGAPGLVVLAAVGLRRHWGPAARFTLVALNVAVYLPYFAQSARFMLPSVCLLTVFAAGAFGSEVRGKRRVLARGQHLVEEQHLIHPHACDRVGPQEVEVGGRERRLRPGPRAGGDLDAVLPDRDGVGNRVVLEHPQVLVAVVPAR